MRLVLSALWIAFFALLGPARAESADTALSAAIDGAWREPQSRARDAYRHPYESLTFWGLKPGMTVVEVDPGVRGWWTEILAPYARATGGAYIAALPDRAQSGAASESPDAAHAAFWKGVGDKSVFGEVTMLRPGGFLAVEQHRAPEGADPRAGTGYVPESYVIEEARKAGFVLEAKSEINTNPKDTRDHPFGVWTLPPTRRSAPAGQPVDPNFDHAKIRCDRRIRPNDFQV